MTVPLECRGGTRERLALYGREGTSVMGVKITCARFDVID